jgi:adenylate cyclase
MVGSYLLERSRRRVFLEGKRLEVERAKSERLLRNVLPPAIAERLKKDPSHIADGFSDVTVLFADIVGFTVLAARLPPAEVVSLLNRLFTAFDDLAEERELEKIKTIGDAYMVVGGLPEPREDHAQAVAELALAMREAVATVARDTGHALVVRIGIHSGPVVAGVIGKKKLSYDLWGDTVNTASRMESHGVPGEIQISETTCERLKASFDVEARGTIEVKGKGELATWMLRGRRRAGDAV